MTKSRALTLLRSASAPTSAAPYGALAADNRTGMRRLFVASALILLTAVLLIALATITAPAAQAALPANPTGPDMPVAPTAPMNPDDPAGGGMIDIDINGVDGEPSSAIVVLLALTALSVAPALLLMTTSFTKILVVLGITRNAIGLSSTPPTQVLAGLALFLSLFIMAPVISDVNETGVQPYLDGSLTASEAFEVGQVPLKEFMLSHTRESDIALITRVADRPNPETRDDVDLVTLVPAFVLSELRAAFVIGFVVFVPFLIIDLVTAASLMAMGMMMLPPVMISLPFKLLLFVMVDGWTLIITALVGSYG